MEITYDKEADAMYIHLKEGTFSENKVVNDNTIIDVDKEGEVLGIELLWVSERFGLKNLNEIRLVDLNEETKVEEAK